MASPTTRPASSRTRGTPRASVRKPGVRQVVDTNPLSYDRTDPFTALNVLRKLLSVLPSRIGGCQYKFTPEEHKLSLHLLTIVEPFVGLAPSRRTLTRQPTEILDAIVFHVNAKRDLLALALSCRRLHTIIFPRHYDYRVIRCKVSSLSVWNHLIVNRSLARNVRCLEILDQRSTEPESVPSDILTTDTDLESSDDELGMHMKQERFLVSALTRMTALDSFIWSCNHSPISIDNVWPTLPKCQSLKEVQITDNLVFASNKIDVEEDASRKPRPPVLRELKTVGLHPTKHTYGATRNPDLSRISAMLSNCPNLEVLDIGYTARQMAGYFNPVADDFLLCGRWPNLRSLTLTNLWCTPHAGFDASAAFLYAHANLEVLHLDITFGTAGAGRAHMPFVFQPNCLPRLREVKASKELVSAILQSPCDAPGGRPLEIIKGVRLSGSAWDHVFLANLKKYGVNTVRRLELVGWNEMEDVRRLAECAPRLTWLDLGRRGGPGAPTATAQGNGSKPASIVAANAMEWATLLANMPELTTFHGVRFFYEVSSASADPSGPISLSDRSRVRKNDEVASLLAWKCNRLRRLDHWEEGSGKVIVLLRDSEKVRYEVRRIKA